MASIKRDNYKAKWLAALADSQKTPTQVADHVDEQITAVEGTQLGIVRELRTLHGTLVECGGNAKSLCSVMDESRDVGGIQFQEVVHGIDTRLTGMPSNVIARRLRDILHFAEERIGILSAMCDNYYEGCSRLSARIDALVVTNRTLQNTILESVAVGKEGTAHDIDEYFEHPASSRRHREYTDATPEDTLLLTFNRVTHPDMDASNHIGDIPDERRDSLSPDPSATQIVKTRVRLNRKKTTDITFD